MLQVRFNKQIFYQIELKTRIAKLTMNEKGLILQEDWKEPVITVIHFQTQKMIKLRLPGSFNESSAYQKECEKELVSNLIQKAKNNKKVEVQKMIQAEIRKSEPVHGHLVIFDTNLIIAMNHKLVSLPLANYLGDSYR